MSLIVETKAQVCVCVCVDGWDWMCVGCVCVCVCVCVWLWVCRDWSPVFGPIHKRAVKRRRRETRSCLVGSKHPCAAVSQAGSIAAGLR